MNIRIDNPDEQAHKLIQDIRQGIISIEDKDEWGKKADSIDKAYADNDFLSKERLWKELLDVIESIEKQKEISVPVHKGLIFFKIATRRIASGHLLDSSTLHWLDSAVKEDERHYGNKWPLQSAFRLQCIIKLFQEFLKDKEKKEIVRIIMQAKAEIGGFLCKVYDRTVLEFLELRTLPHAPFKRLVKGSKSRLLFVMECYDGAQYLLKLKDQLKSSNLEKYGVALAIIVLCGSTLEGIIFSQKDIGVSINSEYGTLGMAVDMLAPMIKDNPELSASLLIIWLSRNLIHPERRIKYKEITIDMNYADFVWEITNVAIVSLDRFFNRRVRS